MSEERGAGMSSVPPEDRMTVGQVIQGLQEMVLEYPEFVNSELMIDAEDVRLFYAIDTDIANGPWLIIREDIDKSGEVR